MNSSISNLYLKYGCIPFDEMPFFNSLIKHPPKLSSIFICIPCYNRQHEILARKVKINTEVKGHLFTPISDLIGFGDIPELVRRFRDAMIQYYAEDFESISKMHAKVGENNGYSNSGTHLRR